MRQEKAIIRRETMLLLLLATGLMLLLSTKAGAVELKKHSFDIGPIISYMTYEETDVQEKGIMYGVEGSYTYHGDFGELAEHVMLKIEDRFSYGQVDYDGQLTDGTSYEINDIDDYLNEVRGVVGYDMEGNESWLVTPYFGLGYRYLNNDLSNDPAGYERESNYLYSPVGTEIKTTLNDQWTLGIKAEYDIFWWGEQKSHLSDAIATLNDIENDQNGGYGVRGAITIEKKGEKVDLVFEPFIQYWDINESDTASVTLAGTIIGEAYEPANTTTEYGLKVAACF